MNRRKFIKLLFNITLALQGVVCLAQQKSFFEAFPADTLGIKLYELYTTMEGVTHFTSSVGIWKLKGHQFDGPAVGTGMLNDDKGNPERLYIKVRSYLAEDSIRSMAQGPDSIFYFVAHDNFFLWRPNGEVGGWGWPPLIFQNQAPLQKSGLMIRAISLPVPDRTIFI